jgi:hypothetical protein
MCQDCYDAGTARHEATASPSPPAYGTGGTVGIGGVLLRMEEGCLDQHNTARSYSNLSGHTAQHSASSAQQLLQSVACRLQ